MAEPARAARQGVNVAEYTVSDLSAAIKRSLEDNFGFVRLRGEISGYRGPHASGHCYFSLKDDKSKIEAVVWRGSFAKLRFRPEEGLEVVAQGRITSFPGASKYQIVIETLEPAGIGALMALLEERKRKLSAEGLFEDARKRPLPFLPAVVGIVTSPTGAVIRDMLAGFTERFPARVVLWPVRVQGETCAREVATAIRGFNALPVGGRLPRPDVLIVARGGGSLEDLWGFNEEIVVRAAAESQIPLISAVGHETDWTLIDLAADARAPTPTKAAEWAVPKHSELVERTSELGHRLVQRTLRRLEEARAHWRAAARGLPRPEDLVALPRQRFDAAEKRLSRALMANTQAHGKRLARVAPRLQPRLLAVRIERETSRLDRACVRAVQALGKVAAQRRLQLERAAGRLRPSALATRVERCSERFEGLSQRTAQAFSTLLSRRRQRLDAQGQMLASLSYRSVLGRGFAVVRDDTGRAIRSVAGIAHGARIDVEVADGHAQATVVSEGPSRRDDAAPRPDSPATAPRAASAGQPRRTSEPVRNRPPPSSRGGSDGQGSLF
ncbi:MAG: exodeoxyribonuclease VII large subunit [Hyphomicrobiaceae bacterium]|nr:exodeoxyribonuclease VII large subunit [Hyphomicrobiaceae bacterium]